MFKSKIVRDRLPDLSSGFYLWVWYADKIPPHIGCSLNGLYYSLKVSGKDQALPVNRVLDLVLKKEIAFLLVELNSEVTRLQLDACFDQYEHATIDRSCLTPILDVFTNPRDINLLRDLLAYLEQRDGIKCIFGLNLPEKYEDLPVYSINEVKSRLLKLERAEKQVNIS